MKVSKLVHNRKRARLLAGAAAIAAATFILSACTGGGGGSSSDSDSGDDNSAAGVKIVVIGGGGDPFFSTVQRGVDAAAESVKAAGGEVSYLALKNYDNLGPDTAQLTKTAIAQKPSAIAVPDWVPDAQDDAIKEAVAAGIPVVIYNAGDIDKAEELGAMTYIGTDDHLAGVAAGETFLDAGSKNVICVNTVPGSANLEARCAGVKEGMESGGGASESLNLPSTAFGNQTAVTQAIKSAIQQDDTIDGIITIGVTDSESADAAVTQAGAEGRVKLVSFDVATAVLERIQSGKQYAAIDQQPYAQGYYAVSALFQFAAYGIELPTKPILTGPLVITSENVDAALKGAEAGTR
ncbi:sugar ABC transporter substrate-binding protein [Microbacterium sp. Marseille-Q6648]|uniref:sugar ABC transporter substrate-binding protein n=1 Tax=Microbacterium sp. Marseille-Q6648 TaxID=2937991 RepID=UPI00203D803B|nr:sugar ABC transporter substrate-binding protein [Microbacterium sp. Marseille-Q6648]